MKRKLLIALMFMSLPALGIDKNGQLGFPAQEGRLHFMENKGQVHDQFSNPRNDIQFSLHENNMSLFIGDGQLHYQFYRLDKPGFVPKAVKEDIGKKATPAEYSSYRMDVELIGANKNAQVISSDKQNYVEHYYQSATTIGTSMKRENKGIVVDAYNKITYTNVYPNIDWVIYVKEDKVEYEFVVKPGGNPSDIKLKYSGASDIKINKDGSLTATTPFGEVKEAAPYSYQQDRQKVNSSYSLDNDMLTFNVGSYQGTLVIDPSLAWGTYFGDAGEEYYTGITKDASGNLYAIGYTNSPSNMATVGAYQQVNQGSTDFLLSSFTSAGALLWSTYYGSPEGDQGRSISYNPSTGGLYVVGTSTATGISTDVLFGNFSTAGVFLGDVLIGSSSSTEEDEGWGVKCHSSGAVYVCGYSNSNVEMATPGAVQQLGAGDYDGFVFKYDPVLDQINWSTYYGGNNIDYFLGVTTDATGNVFAVGGAMSTGLSTLNTFGGGSHDALILKLTPTGNLAWARYFGGFDTDDAACADIDASGNLYISGGTATTSGLISGGFQLTYGGGIYDGYIAKLTTAGSVAWSSYYGGPAKDYFYGISVQGSVVYIGGTTYGTGLPQVNTGFQTIYGGGTQEGMLAQITTGGTFNWSTYYGGSSSDEMQGLVSDNTSVYIVGLTHSPNNISFNTTVQPTLAGGSYDAYISKINDCNNLTQPGTIAGANPVCAGAGQTYTIPAVTGATSYTWTLPGGWTGTSTANSIFATVGTTGGTISVTANNACGSSPAQTLNVTVNPIPTATITPAGPTTFCSGGSVVLNASTGTGYSWAWFQGATPVGTNASSYTANATGNYTVQITANGCSATSTAVSVTVNPVPPTPTASSNSPLCVGPSIFFTCTSTPGATYSWSGPNSFASTVQNPVISGAQIVNTGIYTVTVTVGGCSSSDTTYVHVADAIPATPMVSGDISICEFSTGNVYATGNDPSVAYYTWTLPVGWTGSSNTSSITTAAGSAGTSQVSATAINGCGTSPVGILNVTVNANPVATITSSGNILTVTGTFTSYQWCDGVGVISGATAQSYFFTATGSYYCVVTDANGCTDTSNTLTFTMAVNNVSKVSSVNLYPNPNTGSFTIEGAFASNDGKANIAIVDVAGRIVQTQEVSVSNNKLSVRIDMTSTLAAGVYTIKVSSDAANAVIPFVKN